MQRGNRTKYKGPAQWRRTDAQAQRRSALDKRQGSSFCAGRGARMRIAMSIILREVERLIHLCPWCWESSTSSRQRSDRSCRALLRHSDRLCRLSHREDQRGPATTQQQSGSSRRRQKSQTEPLLAGAEAAATPATAAPRSEDSSGRAAMTTGGETRGLYNQEYVCASKRKWATAAHRRESTKAKHKGEATLAGDPGWRPWSRARPHSSA